VSNDPNRPSSPAAGVNARFRGEQSPSRESFLTVEHSPAGGRLRDADVEGAVLTIDDKDVIVTLEDGERLVFDATELRSALKDAA